MESESFSAVLQDKLRAEARSLLRSVAGESEAVFGRVCSFLAFFCFCLQHVGGVGHGIFWYAIWKDIVCVYWA